MKKETLYAYLAGAIDSDGTIGIKKSTYAMRVRKDATQAVYSERVTLRQVTAAIPTLLRDTFGGSLYITKPSTKNGRPLYSWAATDLKAVACVEAVRLFLTVKRAQADNVLRLRKVKVRSMAAKVRPGRGHAGAARRPVHLTAAMEALYLEAKRLNVTGV